MTINQILIGIYLYGVLVCGIAEAMNQSNKHKSLKLSKIQVLISALIWPMLLPAVIIYKIYTS